MLFALRGTVNSQQPQQREREPQSSEQGVWKPINIININTSEVRDGLRNVHDKSHFVLKLKLSLIIALIIVKTNLKLWKNQTKPSL